MARKFFWFYFPFVSYIKVDGVTLIVAGGNPQPRAIIDSHTSQFPTPP